MGDPADRRSGTFTRRRLLLGTSAAAVAGFTGSHAAAQTAESVASITLLESGGLFARFAGLIAIQSEMDLPTLEALQTALDTDRVPVIKRPPSIVLRQSPQLAALTAWIEQLQTYGATTARKTLQAVARDANGNVLYRLRLRNAIPGRIAKGGFDIDPDGTFVARALIYCTRIEMI
jgi:hypothetical protein